MKTVRRWLASIPCLAILALLASCATIPTDSTVGSMSVEKARKVLSSGLNDRCTWGYKATRLPHGSSCEGIIDVRVTSRRLLVTDKRGKQSIYIFSELPQLSKSGPVIGLEDGSIFGESIFLFKSSFDGDDVVNAIYVLKQNAIKASKSADEFDASFATSLADYRNKAASSAALPEEANKYKVQAEGAVRDKALDDAADYYAEALKIVPWWPAGHFNRALVLGEIGDYEFAQREMKYYLQLVPAAQNARAAQDKIYEWERLESR